ncbi:MAG: hypothetical protein ABRQ39_32955, partial [Candidatus Eremiobacterota bacterium]
FKLHKLCFRTPDAGEIIEKGKPLVKEYFDKNTIPIVKDRAKLLWVDRKESLDIRNDDMVTIKVAICYIDENGEGKYRSLEVGDKLSNRHGNKGVVSLILEDKEMPYFNYKSEKKRLDVLLNPVSCIRRSNLGQLYEISSTLLAWLENEKNGKKNLPKVIVTNFCDDIKINGNKVGKESLKKELEKYSDLNGVDFSEGNVEIIIPPRKKTGNTECEENKEISNEIKVIKKITAGYCYMIVVDKAAHEQLLKRGDEGPVKKVTRQAVRGRLFSGGCRLGEMEIWSLASMGADRLLSYFMSEISNQYNYYPNAFCAVYAYLMALGEILEFECNSECYCSVVPLLDQSKWGMVQITEKFLEEMKFPAAICGGSSPARFASLRLRSKLRGILIPTRLKEKKIITEQLRDLLNKDFIKESLINELKKRNISDKQIKVILNHASKWYKNLTNNQITVKVASKNSEEWFYSKPYSEDENIYCFHVPENKRGLELFIPVWYEFDDENKKRLTDKYGDNVTFDGKF